VREKIGEYDILAQEQELDGWVEKREQLITMVEEIAHNPQAVTWAIEGEDILLPQGLTAEESAGCFAENFFLCVRDEVPVYGEEAIAEFALGIVN